jgi:large subunit ribosomal protein L6
MSRIGKSVITIPPGVQVTQAENNMIKVKGPKGELVQGINQDLTVKIEDNEIFVERPTEQKRHKSMHGLYNSLIRNMIIGVSEGYIKELELSGVGFRASNNGNLLELSIGYSHPVLFYDDLKLETSMEKGKNPMIRLEGIDKQLIGQVAAKIRSIRKPEPYKGKGIKFVDEHIRRKAGKTAAK